MNSYSFLKEYSGIYNISQINRPLYLEALKSMRLNSTIEINKMYDQMTKFE